MAEEPKTEAERQNLLKTLRDELQLQAWLGEAERREPSEHIDEVRPLAQLRDELRLQLHLGKLEAQDEFERLEGVWRDVKHRLSRAAEDAEEDLRGMLQRIRDGYRELLPDRGADEDQG